MDPLAALAFVDQPLAGLAGGLEGAGDAGGDVDRDDLAAGVEQRLVDGEEVADRGLRGGRAALGGAQPLVEVGVVGDLGLRLLLAVDRDVEADRLDAPLGDQRRREGRRCVSQTTAVCGRPRLKARFWQMALPERRRRGRYTL